MPVLITNCRVSEWLKIRLGYPAQDSRQDYTPVNCRHPHQRQMKIIQTLCNGLFRE